MEVSIGCKLDLRGLNRLRKAIHHDNSGPSSKLMQDLMTQWAVRYRAYLQQRFDTYSKGGGDWKPLAEFTLKQRMKASTRRLREAYARGDIDDEEFDKKLTSAKKKDLKALKKFEAKGGYKGYKKSVRQGTADFSILRDTGTLFNALSANYRGAPGALQEYIPYGIRVGYGGQDVHPDSGITIADIASFHQKGGGRLPQRKIIVLPPDDVLQAMVNDTKKALLALYHHDEAEQASAKSASDEKWKMATDVIKIMFL